MRVGGVCNESHRLAEKFLSGVRMEDVGRAVDEYYLIQKRLKESARFAVDEGNDDNVTSGGVNQAKGLSFTRIGEPLALKIHSPPCSGCVIRPGGK